MVGLWADGLHRHAAGVGGQPQHRLSGTCNKSGGSPARPLGASIASFILDVVLPRWPPAYISGGSSLLVQVLTDAGMRRQPGAGGLGLHPAIRRHGLRRHQTGGLPQPPDVHRQTGDHGGVLACCCRAPRDSNLLAMPLGQGLLLAGLPVIFTSFGFHGSIPSVMLYLGDCPRQLRRVFVWAPPSLILYVLWRRWRSWGCWASNPDPDRRRARQPARQRRQPGELAAFNRPCTSLRIWLIPPSLPG